MHSRSCGHEESARPPRKPPTRRSRLSPAAEDVLALQQSAGNAAVSRVIGSRDLALSSRARDRSRGQIGLRWKDPAAPLSAPVVQRDGTGLAGKKASKGYAKTISKRKAGWNTLSVLQRISALLDPANAQLAKVGVPAVSGVIDPLGAMHGTAERAAFNRGLWQVWFNPDYLGPNISDEEFGRIANTAYHECRHAEQTFRVARKLAAEGRDAPTIAGMIGIPQRQAQQAVDYPLPRKSKQEWAEAEAWQLNMEVGPGTVPTPSRADLVNAQKDTALAEYDTARGVWRTWEKLFNNDPAVDPAIKLWYDGEMLKPGGAARLKAAHENARTDYILKRERAKQAFLQYAMMPVEEDAWATGALIEAHLGLNPTTAKDELENLDADERTMVPVVLVALSTGSAKEQQLLSVLKGSV